MRVRMPLLQPVSQRRYKEIHDMNHKVLLTGALLAGTIALGGCASTSEIATLRTQVEQAQATADSAATSAAAASRDAAEAKALAEQAQADAAAAKAKSEDTDAKIDRMFKKTMYK
jgi:murein lipoprotein